MVAHVDLTGADLHEPKGVASASSGQIYVADGSGSGTWQTVGSTSLNASSIKNVNKYKYAVRLDDVSTNSFVLVPVPEAATLTKCTAIIANAITVADATLTFTNSTGPVSLGTLTIAQSGSAEGSRFTFSPASNNSFTAGSYLKIASDGGSTDACEAVLFLEWTLT